MPVSTRTGPRIHYDISGAGPPLLMLHAMPFDRHLWMYQTARFSGHFTTVTLDLRGMGRSETGEAGYGLMDMGADALAILEQEGLTAPPILMGCSVGSKIALALACADPHAYRAVIAVGGNSGFQDFSARIAQYEAAEREGRLAAQHLAHLRHGVSPAFADSPLGAHLIDGFARRGSQLTAAGLCGAFRALQATNLLEALPACPTPTLVVNGEHDSARAGGERTASLMPNARHVVIPDAGHCCFLEDPATFDRCVEAFMAAEGVAAG